MKRLLVVLFSIALSGFSFISHAEEEFKLETMTVTAEKRAADSQKVSTPMNVMSESFIADASIKNIEDIGRYVPNISISSSFGVGSHRIIFRGMEPNGFTETNPVVLNVDGLAHDRSHGFGTTFDDIERIEVLRGPQGTLYGKNAMGGVINIITSRPGNEIKGRFTAGVEERNGYKAGFNISAPIKKDLFFIGLSGGYSRTDGYIEDRTDNGIKNFDEKSNKNISLKLRATPGTGNEIFFKYSHSKAEDNAPPMNYGKSPSNYVDTGLPDYSEENTTDSFVLNLKFDRKAFNTESITTYKKFDDDALFPFGKYGPVSISGVRDITDTAFTQELRLSSSEESRIKWLAGLYYDQNKQVKHKFSMSMGGMDSVWRPETRSKTYSAFAESTIPLGSDKLSVTVGGRFEKMDRELDYKFSMKMPGSPAMDMPEYTVDKTWESFLGKVALNYQATNDIRYYTSVTQGYAPGGFNYTISDKNLAQFDEAKSVNYEIGMKSNFFNRKLMLNANFFYTIYDDLQTTTADADTRQWILTNAGRAHATGIEMDIAARPLQGLDIYGTLGLMEAKYDDFQEDDRATNSKISYDDNNILGAPKIQATIGTKYRHSTGLFGMVDVKYVSKAYYDKANNSDMTIPNYSVINVKAGYESGKRLDVYAYVRNIGNEAYFTFREPKMNPTSYFNAKGEPRTFGVEASYRF